MRVLLHTCCAPCLIYPHEVLTGKGFEVAGFFYNPNIHPFKEYTARKSALSDYCVKNDISVFYPGYNPSEFFQAINLMEDRLGRCPICWFERLKRTAQFAKENKFDYFTTTLLASPYQDQEALSRIGNDIARDEGIKFFYQDFRPGFRGAHNKAKAAGIYCQNYCGCIYSEIERFEKKAKS